MCTDVQEERVEKRNGGEGKDKGFRMRKMMLERRLSDQEFVVA
jgi:hypothetical protein